jgi:hypothetical protein
VRAAARPEGGGRARGARRAHPRSVRCESGALGSSSRAVAPVDSHPLFGLGFGVLLCQTGPVV